MFLNINGTVAKRLREFKGKKYKQANQCFYPADASSEAIHCLEFLRSYKRRMRLTLKDGSIVWGYVRHVEIDGARFPQLFCYKNSTKGKEIPFPLKEIKAGLLTYYRAA